MPLTPPRHAAAARLRHIAAAALADTADAFRDAMLSYAAMLDMILRRRCRRFFAGCLAMRDMLPMFHYELCYA